MSVLKAKLLRKFVLSLLGDTISDYTKRSLVFDLLRYQTREENGSKILNPTLDSLHLGSGQKKVSGWLNTDVLISDYNADFASGHLPFADNSFKRVVSEHVIEHLEIDTELLPMLRDLIRVCKNGAVVYLTCPDLDKWCRSYLENRGQSLLDGREAMGITEKGLLDKYPTMPQAQILNECFFQGTEHKNIYDFDLLKWILLTAGFQDVQRISEADFAAEVPDFKKRQDDFECLAVKATVQK
jgi:predicted SAM-dependent methyltransferase